VNDPRDGQNRPGDAIVMVDLLRIIGETANSTKLAMSKIEMNPCDNRLTWNGVNMPRIARKGKAHRKRPVRRQRAKKIIAASDTMMQTAIRYSTGERNSTANARVRVAKSATARVKLHAFEGSPRG